MDPASGTSIDEGTIATDDRMPIWDESASSWKYVTIDNLQDEIDTTGSGGENNEFSFKNVAVSGQTTIVADSTTDTLTFAASGGMTLTTSGNTATFASADTNTTYSAGSNMSLSGTTFSATDTNTNTLTTFYLRDDDDDSKTIAHGKYVKFISATGTAGTNWSGAGTTGDPWVMTITSPDTDNNTTYSAGSNMSLSGTTFSATDTNTTYSEATGSAEGLMSVAHHDKLDGIASSANNYSHPTGAGNKHVPTAGAAGQVLKYSSSGTPVWAAPVVAGTGLGMVGSGNTLTHTSHSGDATGATALTLATVNSNVGSFTNTSITVNAKGLITAASTGSGGGGVPTEITVVDESSDQTCFPLFVTGASGDLAPKTGSNLAFDSAAGKLTANLFLGGLTGDVTGNITGNAATVTTNANLTGDVTSSGNATTIATDAVDIAMLSASGTASSSTFLRGDNSWVTPTDTNTTYSAGSNMALSGTTFSATDTNTTYSAGTGITLSGTTFSMMDPASGTSIDEGTIATDDRMPIWDESASSWKYVTIDNLQDEIDTTGGGGSGATQPLDNLASVAINTSLISDTDNTDDLGSSTYYWKDIYFKGNMVTSAGNGLTSGYDIVMAASLIPLAPGVYDIDVTTQNFTFTDGILTRVL
jgi:hypothetical protein